MRTAKRLVLAVGLALALIMLSACPKQPGEQAGGAAGGGASSSGGSANWGSAPDVAFTDYGGVSHKLSDYAGEPVVLNFWAVW